MKRRSFLKCLFGAAVAAPTVAKLADLKDDNPYAPPKMVERSPKTFDDLIRSKIEYAEKYGPISGYVLPDGPCKGVIMSGTFPNWMVD